MPDVVSPISDSRLLNDPAFLRRVAELSYEEDLPQEAIAQRLSCSRQTIGKALQRAKERGLVRTYIVPDERTGYLHNLSRKARTALKLEDLLLVAGQETERNRAFSESDTAESQEVVDTIAKTAITYLEEMLTDIDVLAVSGGQKFLRRMVSYAVPTKTLTHLRVVATIGAVSPHSNLGDANLIAHDFAQMYGGDYIWFPCPAFMDTAEQVIQARNMPINRDAYSLMQEASILVTSLWLPNFDEIIHLGYLRAEDAQRLKSSYFPVADLNHWLFDRSGVCINRLLDPPPYHLSGLEIPDLQARVQNGDTKVMLVVGGDTRYAPAIKAVIQAGLVNILVTDHLTAAALLDLE